MKCEVRERCCEGGRAGNIKREIERGKDERRQKTTERKRGSDGRVGVSPPLLAASYVCLPGSMNFWWWGLWGWKFQLPAMSKQGEECGNEQHSKAKQTHRQTGGKGRGGRRETKQFRMCCGNEACMWTVGDRWGATWVLQTSLTTHCPATSYSTLNFLNLKEVQEPARS